MIPAFLQQMNCRYLAEEDIKRTGNACLAVIEAKDLRGAAESFLAAGYHLEDVSGLTASEGAVAAYHFDHFDTPGRITVLVIEPYNAKGSAAFPSIAPIFHGAEWHERETRDFFGFTFDGNPNHIPLLLPDDMADVHPLIKEEWARAPLGKILAAPEGTRKIARCADGFTAMNAPVKEEPAAAPAAAAQATPAVKPAEAPAAPAPAAKPAEAKVEAPAEKPAAPAPKTEEAKPAAPAEKAAPAPAPQKVEPAAAKPVEKAAPAKAAEAPKSAEKAPAKAAPAPAKKTPVKTPAKKGGGND